MAAHRWPSPRGGTSDPNYFFRRAFALPVPSGRGAHRQGKHGPGRWSTPPPLVPELPMGSWYVSYPGDPVSP
jgi:hypothetical protein